jgi:para-nitrobenzyl esterase
MIFIHGGGFGWGGSVDPLYDGHNYVKANKDIILITITYRVSILGFLDLTQIKGGENYKESPN